MTAAVYSFLPWYRRGLGGLLDGTPAGNKPRASVKVDVTISGQPVSGATTLSNIVSHDIEIFGPGDIVGIDPRIITRHEPGHWVTNSEPNYLAHIEFNDEDFPWRYSPVGPTNQNLRLTPWLALVVLAETEFTEGKDIAGRPLGFIEAKSVDPFPAFSELWAWAHVHINQSVGAAPTEFVSNDIPAVLGKLEAALAVDRDMAYARIVCPRKLSPDTAYNAFLMPSFETGRLAGLNQLSAGVPSAVTGAWESYPQRPAPLQFPFYHRWYFKTSESGDFESLVRMLKPRVLDARVGYRDIDTQSPGFNLPGITSAGLGGVLKLGGALQAPRSVLNPDQLALRDKFENWDSPGPRKFQTALARLINLAQDYQQKPASQANTEAASQGLELGSVSEAGTDEDVSPDPIIVPPLYGRWHAAATRVLLDETGATLSTAGNWLHQLNLDPRHRVAAAAGTTIIQKNQEGYMDAAWSQIGDVLAANHALRHAGFALQVSLGWHERRLASAKNDPERYLRLTRAAHGRLVSQGATVHTTLVSSRISASFLSSTASRSLRPGGRLARLSGSDKRMTQAGLMEGLNAGKLVMVPPKAPPANLATLDILAQRAIPEAIDSRRISRENSGAAIEMAKIIGGVSDLAKRFQRLPLREAIAISETDKREPGEADPVGTQRLKDAAIKWLDLVEASHAAARRPETRAIDTARLTDDIHVALHPRTTIRKRAFARLSLPDYILAQLPETFDEIMHHPVIDLPMYKPLSDESKDFLMPNLSLIEPNTITTATTNQAFIEAYMVGLNHEFARELLWREYPTDQRGSVFRQFWDVKSLPVPQGVSIDAFRESVRDIPKIHRWPRASKLGTHDNRELPNEQGDNIVLAIRGELLKKYPNTVIYAQKAQWNLNGAGQLDFTQERKLVQIPNGQMADPPHDVARFPLFEAKVGPDIYFFGFDLKEDEAKGRISGPATASNAGWFFVLKERPGEPRFGFDASRVGRPKTVNDIIWTDLIPQGSTRQFIDPAVTLPVFAALGPSDLELSDQRGEDDKVVLAAVSAAKWAYVLYQAPVMVAIHAAEMLHTE
jgi:hypothetical protein